MVGSAVTCSQNSKLMARLYANAKITTMLMQLINIVMIEMIQVLTARGQNTQMSILKDMTLQVMLIPMLGMAIVLLPIASQSQLQKVKLQLALIQIANSLNL